MWIFLSILLFLILLITAVLLLPIYVIIKTDEDGKFCFAVKILNKVLSPKSTEPKQESAFAKNLKGALGISRLEKQNLKTNIQKTNLIKTIRDSLNLIVDLLKELVGLLKYCKAKVFKLNIVCADNCAAEAAITYGECCAVAAPVLAYLHCIIDIKPSGKDINILCKYDTDQSSFYFETVLSVRICHILAALLRTIFAEAKRRIIKSRSAE